MTHNLDSRENRADIAYKEGDGRGFYESQEDFAARLERRAKHNAEALARHEARMAGQAIPPYSPRVPVEAKPVVPSAKAERRRARSAERWSNNPHLDAALAQIDACFGRK